MFPLLDKKEINFHPVIKSAIKKEIQVLLDKEVIEQTSFTEGQVVSNVFVRDKKDGTFRVILNLREFNKQLNKIHFKMESLQNAIDLMTEGCFFASLDLKDAYFSVNIHPQSRKFFRFKFQGILYQFRGLPQGFKDSPRIFTKIIKPILGILRTKGHKLVGYIDDFCVKGNSKKECTESIKTTGRLFDELGFTVHPSKSVFEPANSIVFLGFVLDSIKMEVSVSDEKAKDIQNKIQVFLKQTVITIRDFAKIIGMLVALNPGVYIGPIFWRRLEIEKAIWLRFYKGNFDSCINISLQARQDLEWWIDNIQKYPVKVIRNGESNPLVTLTTDASGDGWGAVDQYGKRTGGNWSSGEKDTHINGLELKAVLLGLQALCDDLRDTDVRIYTDNSTTMSCINRKGSAKEVLNSLARLIWLWALDRNIMIHACHIPGSKNTSADSESRKKRQVEWKLKTEVFKELEQIRGPFLVDLFASRISFQVDKYVSWLPDPGAWKIDAFSLEWNMEGIYCFPPFCLISRILSRLIQQEATMTIIAPRWQQQVWYPQIMELLIDLPVVLPKVGNIVTDPVNGRSMNSVNLRLMACTISGDSSKQRAFQKTLETLSVQDGEGAHKRHTMHLSKNGHYSVTFKDGTWWLLM